MSFRSFLGRKTTPQTSIPSSSSLSDSLSPSSSGNEGYGSFLSNGSEPEVFMSPMDLLTGGSFQAGVPFQPKNLIQKSTSGGGSLQPNNTSVPQSNSGPKLRTISVPEILRITGNFSRLRIMAERDSWVIYRGDFTGKTVAVHKVSTNREELDSMSTKMLSINHDHVAKTIAWCPENSCIVVEISKGKSLREKLTDGTVRWQDRCRIAVEIATAVEYLMGNSVAVNGIDSNAICLDENNVSKFVYSITMNRMDKQSSFRDLGLLFLELLSSSTSREVQRLSTLIQTSRKPASVLIENIGSRMETWPEDVLTAFVNLTMVCLTANRQNLKWKTLISDLAQLRKLVGEAERQSSKKSQGSSSSRSSKQSSSTPTKHTGPDLLEGIHLVTKEQLATATDKFSPKNVIGKGGFGVVYKGHHQGVEVAIKKLHSSSSNDALTAEVQIQHTLRHQHILSLYAYEPETPCLVSEYMAGGSLDSWLNGKQGKLTWVDKVRICREMSAAVVYMHARNVVHRDLKLPNVLLDEHKRSKICDLGLAKAYVGEYTKMSQMQGTSGYIDPHIQNTGNVSAHSDTYALGLIIMQVLTGICHIHDLHRLLDKFKKPLAIQEDLIKTLDDLDSDDDIPIPVPEASSSGSRWDLRPEKFSLVINQFCQYLDPRSGAMPKSDMESVVDTLLRCVERKWEYRASLTELLSALEILEQESKKVDAEYLSGPTKPLDEESMGIDSFAKSPLKFESNLSKLKIKIEARVSARQETKNDAKFLVAIQKRQKLTRKMLSAITRLKGLEDLFAKSVEADKSRVKRMIESAECEAKTAVDEANIAEEEYDSVLTRNMESDMEEDFEREAAQQLMALHKEIMEESNKATTGTEDSMVPEVEMLSNKEDALKVREEKLSMEQEIMEGKVIELDVKQHAKKALKCEHKQLLVREKDKLMEESTSLQHQLNRKLSEVGAQNKDILAVNKEIELLVSSFDKIRSGLQLKTKRVDEEMTTIDLETESLRVTSCEVEGLMVKAEQNIKMCSEIIEVTGELMETLEKEVKVEKKYLTSVERARKEKLGELAVQERSLWEIQTTSLQQMARQEDDLKTLDIARTKLQHDRATCQAQLTFSEKRKAELQTEKKLAAGLKNFTEAARFANNARILVGEIAELEEEIEALGTQIEAMDLYRNNQAKIIAAAKEKLVESEKEMAKVRCEWLRSVSFAAKQEIDVAAQREEFDKAELLKMEPDLADEEADRLRKVFGLQEKRFERWESVNCTA